MRLTDFNQKITAESLNEGLEKQYGQRIAVEKYTLEQLQDARNNLRTQLRDIETNESFNAVDGPVYQKTKSFLDVLNAEISEREHIEEKKAKPDYLDMDGDGDKKEPMKKAIKDKKKKGPVKETKLAEDARELMAYLKDQGITDVDPKLQLAIRDYFYDKKKNTPQTKTSSHPRYGDEQDWDWKGALEAEAEILMKAGYSREEAYKKAYSDIKHRRAFEPGGSHYNAMKRHYKKTDDLRARKARGEIPQVSSDKLDQIRARSDANFKRMGGKELESVQNEGVLGSTLEKTADMVQKYLDKMGLTKEKQAKIYDKVKGKGDKAKEPQDESSVNEWVWAAAGGAFIAYGIADALMQYKKDGDESRLAAALGAEAAYAIAGGSLAKGIAKGANFLMKSVKATPGAAAMGGAMALDPQADFVGYGDPSDHDEWGKVGSAAGAAVGQMGRSLGITDSIEESVTNSIVNALMEGEEEKAALVMASKDMVDKVTSWMEDTAEMQTESMLELGDKIRDEVDSATSEQFINTVKPALEALFTALETARGSLSGGVAIVTGEGDDMMGSDMSGTDDTGMDDAGDDMDMDMEPTVDNDEFGADAASAGGEEEAGREKRESVERSRRLGTILSKKK
jgi:hypothetical protein